jgi:REP element-mobilizing transposase RayT
MPQSLSEIILHLIFSTKGREPFLQNEIRERMHAYLGAVARNSGCEAPRVGGVEDHVHVAIKLSRTLSVAALVEELKTSSSIWIKQEGTRFLNFQWQRGYAVFSVSPGNVEHL